MRPRPFVAVDVRAHSEARAWFRQAWEPAYRARVEAFRAAALARLNELARLRRAVVEAGLVLSRAQIALTRAEQLAQAQHVPNFAAPALETAIEHAEENLRLARNALAAFR